MLEKLLSRLRREASKDMQAAPTPRKAAGRLFVAVTIVPGTPCCHAARTLAKERILADRAPRLPLADCSQPDVCNCTFEKHADRRAGKDRRTSGLWQPGLWKDGGERRKNKGRRSSDR
jgi:hypothetical protein